jgi:hypothetical protein
MRQAHFGASISASARVCRPLRRFPGCDDFTERFLPPPRQGLADLSPHWRAVPYISNRAIYPEEDNKNYEWLKNSRVRFIGSVLR